MQTVTPKLEEFYVKKKAYIAPKIIILDAQKHIQSHLGIGGDGNFSGENHS